MTQIPIALQLYTVRDDAEKDLAGTFAKISSIGYTNVELAGFYDKSASEVGKVLADNNLKPISAHIGLHLLEGEDVGKTIDDYLSLGVYSFVIPWLDSAVREGGAGYAALADKFNKIGELVNRYGVTLSYHNHDFEFVEKHEGKLGIDILLENTDPSLVKFELDTYWVLFAGNDPVEFIKNNGSRLSLLHIKDLDPTDRSFAPVGTGLLPLDGIVAAAADTDVSYLIVEQDVVKGPALDAIELSLNNLKAKGYA